MAERLLHDDAAPGAPLLPDQPGLAQAAHDLPEEARRGWRGRRARSRPSRAAWRPGRGGPPAACRPRVGELARLEVHGLAKLCPGRRVHGGRRELPDALRLLLAELLVRLVAPRDPHDRELLGQEPERLEVVERRHELPLRQVTGGAEDHHGAGRRRAGPGRTARADFARWTSHVLHPPCRPMSHPSAWSTASRERREARGNVGAEVHAQRAAAALGEDLEVPPRLRRLHHAEGVPLARHRQRRRRRRTSPGGTRRCSGRPCRPGRSNGGTGARSRHTWRRGSDPGSARGSRAARLSCPSVIST